jgi:lysine 2,3-aminomutase
MKNPKVFSYFKISEDSPEWNDWRWQFAHRITDVQTLAAILPLSTQEKRDIALCLLRFRMAITPYFLSLIDPSDPSDPLRKQAVPVLAETETYPWEKADPLNEEGDSPVPAIVHRYPDRVLLLVTKCCATYCRHCTRRRLVGEEDAALSDEELGQALDYIRSHKEIRDVLVSGGDPLTLSDERIESILAQIRSIPHVEIIRIGTRVPCTLPMRITDSLLSRLKKYHPLWINTHFNHPKELTPEACQALGKLADAGIPLGNQSVLLKGVNDSPEIIKELCLGLVKARVRPYYLYQCDLSQGLEHFRTDVRLGIEIEKKLQGNITGFAVPKFVIDSPGGGGKVPINPEYVLSLDDDQVIFRNYEDKVFAYPQPHPKKK